MKRWYYRTGDVVFALLWTGLAAAAVLVDLGGGPVETVVRVGLTLPVVAFVPGYLLVTALFPEHPESHDEPALSPHISGFERAVLSVVMSLVLVPLVGFAVNYTFSLRLRPILYAIVALTAGLAVLAFVRRIALPLDERWGVTPIAWTGNTVSNYFSGHRGRYGDRTPLVPTNGSQRLLNLVLVGALLLFVASVGFAAVVPDGDAQEFTELYLLAEDDEGNLTTLAAENLNYQQGQETTLYVGIGNHEKQSTTYTVVIALEGEQLDRFSTSLADGEDEQVERAVAPTQSGQDLQMQVLLYRGEVGDNPTPDDAYRELDITIDVG